METTTTTKAKRILRHPVTRIILGLLLCFIAFILAQNIAGKLLDLAGAAKTPRNLIKAIVSALAVLFTYSYFFQSIENRKITELSAKNLEWNLVIGISIGTNLQLLTLAVIYFVGDISILTVNNISALIVPFAVALTVAIFEEILMRGILFRIAEQKFGSFAALAISATIFAALHLFNPGASVISTACVGIAGLLFGAAYIYARNLWLPIAIHFAWNFVQSGIFGAVTSGNEKGTSLLDTKIAGSELITGGSFGPEASIQAIVLLAIVTAIFMYLNKGKLNPKSSA